MIADFLSSWTLFHYAYTGGWLLSALLALLGAQLIARDQIFFGAAVAQASTLGIAFALTTSVLIFPGGHLHETAWYPKLWAVACSLAAAFSIENIAGTRESREAVTGFVFLFAAALAMILVAHSPFGLDEVHRLLASSLIGSDATDVSIFAGLLLITAALSARHRDRLLLLAMDPLTASSVGLRTRAWSLGVALWSALVIGLAIRSAGLLFTFGCLILPGLAAKQLAREMRTLFWLAPTLGLASSISGFVLANSLDLPPAQAVVALQGFFLLLLWARALLPFKKPGRARAVN